LPRIAEAVKPFGLEYRHTAGVDMLVQAGQPSARKAVLLVLAGGELGNLSTNPGIAAHPLADLVRMKLTSFRLRDEVHLKDLDETGLITPEIEAGLPAALRARLAQVRACE
jgi:hypothetical protein